MKLTKEDVKKYGTKNEIEFLKEQTGSNVSVLVWEAAYEGYSVYGVYTNQQMANKALEGMDEGDKNKGGGDWKILQISSFTQ